MKNQPNKATVKDGLPTSEQVLHRHFVPVDPFDNLQILQAMKEYSDQQNAELREELKLSEDTIKHQAERCLRLEGRVKELEGLVLEYMDGYIKILNALNK